MKPLLSCTIIVSLAVSCSKKEEVKEIPIVKESEIETIAFTQPEGTSIKQTDFHIFILMGQSNMTGCGELDPTDTLPISGVYKLPTIYKGVPKWIKAAHPLHNRSESNKFGLGIPFAEEYTKAHPGVIIGLIPLAYGGYDISKLSKGSDVYKDFLLKLSSVKQHGTVKAVLWHQGESDTVDDEKTNNYEQKLKKLIEDVRMDVGYNDLPFIVGNLAEFYGQYEGWRNKPDRQERIVKVKEILRAVPVKIPYTAFVETTGCKSVDKDYIHFDRASLITLGKRYYAAYNEIVK